MPRPSMESPLNIPKKTRTTAPLLIGNMINPVTVRNTNKITIVEPPAFAPQVAVDRTVVDSGHGVLPDVPPAGELALRSGLKNLRARLR